MRIFPFIAALTLATPALADLRPDGTTALLGLGLSQNGAQVAMEEHGGTYYATVAPGPFVFTFADAQPEIVAVTFGHEGLFDLIDLPPDQGLFGPGTAYARHAGPSAAHFMTDPLCASDHYGPGFNALDATRATDAGFPVTALQVGSTSRGCEAEDRLPSDTNLLERRVAPLHAVIRTDAGIERLILSFWVVSG